MKAKRAWSLVLVAAMSLSMAACGNGGSSGNGDSSTSEAVPTIDEINVGEDYKDLKAEIKVLTNRTDIVDSTYKEYAEEFQKLYPNITVTYEGITDYEESLTLRLTNGDWGDICLIPTTCDKSEFSTYFTSLGDYDTLNDIYNFVTEKTYEGQVYGIPCGGTAGGIAYNKKVWEEAGITSLPTTPDEFLEDLQKIKDKDQQWGDRMYGSWIMVCTAV